MNYVDIALLIILAFFIIKGAQSGFIKIIGGLIGVVVGAWAAGRFYDVVAAWLMEFFKMDFMAAIVTAFIVIYILVNIAIGIAVFVLTRIFRFIPLATTTNRFIGAVLGFIEGVLLIGVIIWVVTLFPFNNRFTEGLKGSRIASAFSYSTKIVQPLLPKSLKDIDFSLLENLGSNADQKAEYLKQHMPEIFQQLKDQTQSMKNELNGSSSTSTQPLDSTSR